MAAVISAASLDCVFVMLGRGRFALLDHEDAPLLGKWSWYCNSDGYASRAIGPKRRRTTLLLHREIINIPDGMQADHVNRIKLDNRRCNLRVCSQRQNKWNKNKPVTGRATSCFKGVCFDRESSKYMVQAMAGGRIFKARFASEIDAAMAYNKWVAEHHGEFACLNVL